MAGTMELDAKIEQALETATRCTEIETSDNYAVLGEELEELETAIGRFLQSHTAYEPLLKKLSDGAALTTDELKTLRSLVVGDADSYLKYDDDFDRSKTDLGRILDQIRQLRAKGLDEDTLGHLRVLCREASSVLSPTAHYLEQRERVHRFDEATRGPLEGEARRVLGDIIKSAVA